MGTFGYTTAGTAGEEYLYMRAFGSLFTSPPDCGTVTKISVYLNETYQNTSGRVAIYKHSDLSRVAIGDPVNYDIGGFRWIDFPIAATLEPDTEYLLVYAGGFDGGIKYDNGDTNQGHVCETDVLADPWQGTNPPGFYSITHSTKRFSIYATYTPAAPAAPRSASGRITVGAVGLPGVLLTATCGELVRAAMSDANGNFVISGLTEGTWVIQPVAGDYTFSPGSQSVTVEASGGNVTGVGFTAEGAPPEPVAWDPLTDDTFDDPDLVAHVISGKVKDSTGAGISGVEVFLYVGSLDSLDFPRSALTADDGLFSFHVDDGTYVLRAVSDAFAFDPLTVTVAGGDQANQDLAGTAV